MPQLYPYRIFISHAWAYHEEYYQLENKLKGYPNFLFRNYSVPRHDAFDSSVSLKRKLLDQMEPVQVVIIIAGMFAARSDWIQFELEEAVRMGKPIIGVKPWGQERVPVSIQQHARVIHGWNIDPIVQSIRQLARW